ncbi:MAG: wax ester/triacylglycerol synthase family O-acyltransferase, partial [Gammaproteobacteria bacterium]|nr:wax ester/triacylglycerol synthase family O-acyltransferase [Gammaproteobacteria bacterium]
ASLQYLQVAEEKRATFVDDLKAMLLDRIHLVPYLTNKVEFTPMHIDHPVWVRHQTFDIDQHLHRVTVDAPGTIEQVEALVAEIYEPLMDRSKPLWEMWVIDGLQNGQIAFLQKTHHACIDGVSSIKAAELLLDFEPEPRQVEPAAADFWDQERPTYARLLEQSFNNLSRYWWEGVRRYPLLLQAASRASQRVRREPQATSAPKTRFNVSIDAKRSFTNIEMSLSVLKAIAKTTGVKINDVVLAICGEGLSKYLARHGERTARSLVANCPVSLHKAGDESIRNQVGAMNVSMATDVADLVERLAAIHRSSNAAKAAMADLRDAMPTDFGGFGLPAVLQAFSRASESGIAADWAQAVPMNVVVSNVPGFSVPLYVAGARLVGQMPMSIVVHGGAVNLTVTSYLDRMDLGITAASKRIPDVYNLKDDLIDAYDELVERVLGSVDQDLAVAAA